MKRDWELVRKILLKVSNEPESEVNGSLKVEGFSQEAVSYHINILSQADLLSIGPEPNFQFGQYSLEGGGLTWKGNDFLDSICDDSIWEKLNSKAKNKMWGWPSEVVFKIATELVLAQAKSLVSG